MLLQLDDAVEKRVASTEGLVVSARGLGSGQRGPKILLEAHTCIVVTTSA